MLAVEPQRTAPTVTWVPDRARSEREPAYADTVREFVAHRLSWATWTTAAIIVEDGVRWLVAESRYDSDGDALRDRHGRPTTRTASLPLAPDEVGP